MDIPAGTAAHLFTSPSPPRQRERLAHMAASLDSFTRRRLTEAGLRRGARCLVVGASGGSIAGWLAEQVGRGGQVIAVDADASQLPIHPRVVAVAHDITVDPLEALPGRPRRPRYWRWLPWVASTLAGDGFDLVYTRMAVSRMPGRWAIVDRLADVLTPGGALVAEEFDSGMNRYVIETPDTDAYRLFADYHETLTEVLEAAGKDPSWEVLTAMRQAGLADVDSQMWTRAWRGGEPGCLLLRATIELEHLRDKLVETGMREQDLDRLAQLLLNPQLSIFIHPVVSTIGRRQSTLVGQQS